MTSGRYAKATNRSVVGIMNEFSYPAEPHRETGGVDLMLLGLRLQS